MSSLYFLAMLIGIVWLAVWSVLPQPWRGGGWWPFDMREDDSPKADGLAERASLPARQRRAPSRSGH